MGDTFLAFDSEFPSLLATRVTESYPARRDPPVALEGYRRRVDLLCPDSVRAGMRRCHRRVDADDARVRDPTPARQDTDGTLKGGAFLATAPSPDRRVAIPRTVQISHGGSQLDAEETNEATLNTADTVGDFAINYAMDFVGRIIDTGFRVLKFAARSYFVLTVEAAHLLFKHYNDDKTKRGRQAYLLGTHSLKGVWVVGRTRCSRSRGHWRHLLLSNCLPKHWGTATTPGWSPTNIRIAYRVKYSRQSRHTATLKGWQGAVHAPDAHEPDFKQHQAVIDVRQYLDNLNDTSEDPLNQSEDQGEENSVDDATYLATEEDRGARCYVAPALPIRQFTTPARSEQCGGRLSMTWRPSSATPLSCSQIRGVSCSFPKPTDGIGVLSALSCQSGGASQVAVVHEQIRPTALRRFSPVTLICSWREEPR